jgi:NO-binding membrane sensor protein with MHYT domain
LLCNTTGRSCFLRLLSACLESPAGRKPYWVLVAAFAAGLSVWATHFVAMLAYKGAVPIGYDFAFTALSAVLAVFGFWLALTSRSQAAYSPVVVGTLVTLSVAVMHFVGMAGMDVAATISYRWGPVLGGFAVAWASFLLAFFLFRRLGDLRDLRAAFHGHVGHGAFAGSVRIRA